jgi:hypothetical protein
MHHLLHHANCADGFAAACIARHALLTQGVPKTDINVQPVNYGWPDQMPLGKDGILFAGDTVTYLDYTPPQETLDAFYAEHGEDAISLTIIDHHAKAAVIHGRSTDTGIHLANLPLPRFNSWFNLNYSGASITWTVFHQQGQTWAVFHQQGQCYPTPLAVQLIEWRDCGHAFDPAYADDPRTADAFALHAYLFRCLPRTFDAWTPLLTGDAAVLATALQIGARLRSIDQSIILSAAANPHWLNFNGDEIPAVNGLDAGLVSDACTELLRAYPTAPFAASWFIDPKTGNAVYSLRSRRASTINVSDIAASMAPGGGGHPNAAGFSTPIPIPFV